MEGNNPNKGNGARYAPLPEDVAHTLATMGTSTLSRYLAQIGLFDMPVDEIFQTDPNRIAGFTAEERRLELYLLNPRYSTAQIYQWLIDAGRNNLVPDGPYDADDEDNDEYPEGNYPAPQYLPQPPLQSLAMGSDPAQVAATLAAANAGAQVSAAQPAGRGPSRTQDGRRLRANEYRRRNPAPAGWHYCSREVKNRPISDFSRNKRGQLYATCEPCRNRDLRAGGLRNKNSARQGAKSKPRYEEEEKDEEEDAEEEEEDDDAEEEEEDDAEEEEEDDAEEEEDDDDDDYDDDDDVEMDDA